MRDSKAFKGRVRRICAALMIALVSCLFSACSNIDFGIEGLMLPPKLTSEQRMLYSALETAAGTESLRLRYPKFADGNSAFIFNDMDGDGMQEAIVFYSAQDDHATRINILRKTADSWVSVYDTSGREEIVVSVEFASVESGTDIIIGWQNSFSGQKTLTVSRFSGNTLFETFSAPYEEAAVCRLFGSDSDDVLIFSPVDSSGSTQVSLLELKGEEPAVSSQTSLRSGAAEYLSIKNDVIFSRTPAVFVDYVAIDGIVSTDVIYLESLGGGRLKSYFSGRSDAPVRYEKLISDDINGDGLLEIPSQYIMPGTEGDAENVTYITEYFRINGQGLTSVMSAVININDGYVFELPQEWIGNVTLKKTKDNNEWNFFEISESGRNDTELLRIKTVNRNTYHDKFDENYQLVAEKGVNQYYIFVTSSDSGFRRTLSDCRSRFSLLE